MGNYVSLEQMVLATLDAVRPPERLTVAEAAEKYRYLNNPGSFVGNWDNTIAPYLVEPMEVLTSLDYTGMVFVGPARTGKSDLFFNWLTHTAKCDPADMMMIHMTQNTARDWSQGDLRKAFRHSKDLGVCVTPGRQNMNVHDVGFLSGMRLLVKWPTITELSGKTIPRLWVSDYDRMPADVDGEGSVFVQAKKRAQTYGRYGMTVAESSPGFEVENPKWTATMPHEAPPTGGILALYNQGDRRRRYWRCWECGTAFEPDFGLLWYPQTDDPMEAAEAAVLKCPFCDRAYKHTEKNELDNAGKWIKAGQKWMADGSIVGEPVRAEIASFWLKGVAAAFQNWQSLVYNYLTAMRDFETTGNTELLKTTVTLDQGLPFSPKGLGVEQKLPEELQDASEEDLGEKVVPDWVRWLEACVDIQGNRFVVQVMGFGVPKNGVGFGDITIIDRFDIRKSERLDEEGERHWVKPSTYAEDWNLLIRQVILKEYPLATDPDRRMQIKVVGIDTGGSAGQRGGKQLTGVSVTSNAYNFWRYLRDGPLTTDEQAPAADDGWVPGLHRRVQLLKGDGANRAAPRVKISYPDSDRKDRAAGARGEIPVLFINSNLVKDAVYSMLDRDKRSEEDAPVSGRIRFPRWLPDWFYAEMLAESRTEKGWDCPSGVRNEAWDTLCYAYALAVSRHVQIEMLDWANPPAWAKPQDENSLVHSLDAGPAFVAPVETEHDLEALGAMLS